MKQKVFPKLFYLNNFSFCSNNEFINSKLDNYIQTILYTDEDNYIEYLYDLKKEYNFVNYMYILECIINYIIKIYSVTYRDYNKNYNSYTETVLDNIKNRYNNIINLYDISFNERDSKIKNNVKMYNKNRNF